MSELSERLGMPLPRDEVFLRQLAAQIYHKTVFTSANVTDHSTLAYNFAPMLFWSQADLNLAREHIALIWEDMNKSVGIIADGTPLFHSLQTLGHHDFERLKMLWTEYNTWHKAWNLEPTHAGSDSGIPS